MDANPAINLMWVLKIQLLTQIKKNTRTQLNILLISKL